MIVDVLTLFPGMFRGPMEESILKRAREKGILAVQVHNLRDFTHDKHHVVDDKPYGGGPGMLMKPEPIFEGVEKLRRPESRVVLMTPQGSLLNHDKSRELAAFEHIIIVCGHYEGVDERVRQALVTDEISIGNYVLTNGALAAMVVIDAVARFIPGVLGDEQSAHDDSFAEGLLEYPQYTRPREYRGMTVPEVLVSGNHQEVARWRRELAEQRTRERRPDLLPQKENNREQKPNN